MLQMDEGKWFDREGKRAIITQYHEVIGDLLGRPAQVTVQVRTPGTAVLQVCRQVCMIVHLRRLSIAPVAVQIIIIISLVGTNSAQIVASASDAYYLDSSRSKRWAHPCLSQLCRCRRELSGSACGLACCCQLPSLYARGMCSPHLVEHVWNERRHNSRHILLAAQPCVQLLLLCSYQVHTSAGCSPFCCRNMLVTVDPSWLSSAQLT